MMTFVLSCMYSSYAQKDVDPKDMIGFGCYSGGMITKSVYDFTSLLEKSKYQNFLKFLDSKSKSEKFLAAVVCKKLNKDRKLKLSAIEIKKIDTILNSDELVSICSGCTYFSKISFKELSKKNKENFMLDKIEDWLAKY